MGSSLNISLLFRIFTVFILIFPVLSVADAQRDALVDFYASTGGSQWTDKTNWNTSTAYCSWNGIACSSTVVVSMYVAELVVNIVSKSIAHFRRIF